MPIHVEFKDYFFIYSGPIRHPSNSTAALLILAGYRGNDIQYVTDHRSILGTTIPLHSRVALLVAGS
jgi:hypothetical protein